MSDIEIMTREEFRRRWHADDCDITFRDIARCAQEWGIFRSPMTHEMNLVRYRVLQEAGVSDCEDYRPEEAPHE